jgi:hypothetical protein
MEVNMNPNNNLPEELDYSGPAIKQRIISTISASRAETAEDIVKLLREIIKQLDP